MRHDDFDDNFKLELKIIYGSTKVHDNGHVRVKTPKVIYLINFCQQPAINRVLGIDI